MKHIDDRTVLLGLIIDNLPFEYIDKTVSASFSVHVETEDLEQLKASINQLLSRTGISDQEVSELNAELYFIDKMLIKLEEN